MAVCPNCEEQIASLHPSRNVTSPVDVYTCPECEAVLGVTGADESTSAQ